MGGEVGQDNYSCHNTDQILQNGQEKTPES